VTKAEKIWDLKKFVKDIQNDLSYYQRQIDESESMLSSVFEELHMLENEEFKDD